MGSTTALEQPLEHTPHGITKGYMRYGYTMGAVHTFVSSSPLSPLPSFLRHLTNLQCISLIYRANFDQTSTLRVSKFGRSLVEVWCRSLVSQSGRHLLSNLQCSSLIHRTNFDQTSTLGVSKFGRSLVEVSSNHLSKFGRSLVEVSSKHLSKFGRSLVEVWSN